MPDVSEEAEESMNSWLRDQMKDTNSPDTFDLIIETDKGRAEQVANEIASKSGVRVKTSQISLGRYIPATVPNGMVDQVSRMSSVKKVHYDMPVAIDSMPNPLSGFFSAEDGLKLPDNVEDPIRKSVSDTLHNLQPYDDPLLGEVKISEVEVPRVNIEQFGDPLQAAAQAVSQLSSKNVTGKKIINTHQSVEWMLDVPDFNEYQGDGVKAAVLDTGFTPLEPANRARAPYLESQVPGEPPLDGLGHGTWCQYTVGGGSAPSTWGTTRGVAPGVTYGHFKCLNTFPGFGKSSWIIKSMERAVEWGADVVSMSLGGTQQGSVEEDPQVQAIEELSKENMGDDGAIFVIAAGNSGPDKWTIGSPGVAPSAITVGSWSITDDTPAAFSSRGPQGEYYKENPDEYEKHKQKYGSDLFVKPDVAAPGGGRAYSDREPDELLHQTETGWMEGLYDGIKDGRGAMKGTSMATPHFAGFVARLYQAGVVSTAKEVKAFLKSGQWSAGYEDAAQTAFETEDGKNIAAGWGPGVASRFVNREPDASEWENQSPTGDANEDDTADDQQAQFGRRTRRR